MTLTTAHEIHMKSNVFNRTLGCLVRSANATSELCPFKVYHLFTFGTNFFKAAFSFKKLPLKRLDPVGLAAKTSNLVIQKIFQAKMNPSNLIKGTA